ncbi:PaaI family thioesterase [Novosphingobium tardum]|uniref:PaaI family thioesterase n=1 Tax=Novosphingobium tardum TaxID=1538021 RepID=A0ABV8RTD2_9SPHN
MTEIAAPPGFKSAGFSPGFLDRGGPYFLGKGLEGTIVGMRVEEGHLNYQDVAHGGVLTTLADVALSFVLFASEKPPLPVATATLTVNFLGGARLGDWLEAEARIDRIGKRLGYASGTIRCGDTVVATMSGVFSILRR